ncbi:TetR/AcrR family transcriptional regulator [Oleomonas cavernae]|uniref:TetR/AcrR family transcriptional regulator n=1 Tax=Oleomonas cavernae TaxID=2320859 RepID=A0A418W919_9PROT|nr:TetR/AcrR family transcriptional regulator [Oleomonas cavernae]RJF86486.1 TetR/AcrR family transcriptional regulator [Oleomonas cavernae]
MPRIRADDYDAKYKTILDNAAALFADVGYPNAKMLDIARVCGATKSMLYHYFATKDDLLFALLSEHLERLIADIENALEAAEPAGDRFTHFVELYVQKSAQSRQRHVSAMNDVKFLPPEMQQQIRALEAQAVGLVAAILRGVKPGLADNLYKPYALLLLGMLNWTDLWYDPNGYMPPAELRDRIARLFLDGFLAQPG